jgi:hypothetical protein
MSERKKQDPPGYEFWINRPSPAARPELLIVIFQSPIRDGMEIETLEVLPSTIKVSVHADPADDVVRQRN